MKLSEKMFIDYLESIPCMPHEITIRDKLIAHDLFMRNEIKALHGEVKELKELLKSSPIIKTN